MKFIPLLWSNLTGKKLRTAFTFLAVVFAFLLYGVLAAVENAFSDADLAGGDRLRMIHKVTIIEELPVHYYERIVATQGVEAATYVSWFGGEYQDATNFFPQFAVHADTHLDVHAEFLIDPEQRDRWIRTRTGAIVGRTLADRFGWSIGDRIPLRSSIYPQAEGDAWQFTLEGIFTGADGNVDESQMFFHHDYLEESVPWAEGETRWFVIKVADGSNAAEVARRLDAQFANSAWETKTSSEKAFLQSFANQIGDTSTMITSVVGVMFFVILLVVANALAQSVRERLPEFAVLKAMGFSDWTVLRLVVGESLLLCGVSGTLGLLLAAFAVQFAVPTQGMLGVFRVAPTDITLGLAWIVTLSLLSALTPAVAAMRLRAASGLGRH